MEKENTTRPKVGQAFAGLNEEVHQAHGTRKRLYEEIEDLLGPKARLIAYFTSFRHPVVIDDADCDMLEDVLRGSQMQDKELYLMINSPGGDGIAAERIVKVCRAYSVSGKFSVIIPKRAKSAATIICLGANKLLMSETSELGPIDPQFPVFNRRGEFTGFQASHEIIKSYQDLLGKSEKAKGNIEAYLDQLQNYDARQIAAMVSAQNLSEDIAVKLLKTGCSPKIALSKIKTALKPFTDPTYTKSHGRPIYHVESAGCGLKVELHDLKSEIWNAVWALFVRLNFYTEMHVSKAIESANVSCAVNIPGQR